MDRVMRWYSMPVGTQISNIGSEVMRAIRWKNENDIPKMMSFYQKAVELIRLSESDPKNIHRKDELHFCEEELADYFLGENLYGTTEEALIRFYDSFIR